MERLSGEERERVLQYIQERVEEDPLSGCWTWQLSTTDGYGQMRWGDTIWRTHRFVYHHLVDYLPKSKVVHHRCSNRACCRPDHLAAVSHHDNVAEMMGRTFYEEEILHLRHEIEDLQAEIRRLKEAT